MNVDVNDVAHSWWTKVFRSVHKAVVFLDNQTAECLHWYGGLPRLLEAGAIDVKQFSSFESIKPNQKKCVFLLSAALYGVTLNILQDIIRTSQVQYCIVISSAHPSIHHFHLGYFSHGYTDADEVTVRETLEKQILTWMGNPNYMVEIHYQPMFLAPISRHLFVTPPFSNVHPLLSSELKDTQTPKSDKRPPEKLETLEFSHLTLEAQLQLKIFAHCINSFLEEIGVKEDCFSVGHFSRIIVNVLDSLPSAKNRRKVASEKISVLFVDRTLDLVGPSSHGIDTVLDRIMYLLPRLPEHTNDVAVDMSSLCTVKQKVKRNYEVLAPGCLAPTNDETTKSMLHSLATLRHKDCLSELNRHLVEAATKEKLSSPLQNKSTSRLNVETLENHVNQFRTKPVAIMNQCGLLQQALAVIQALQHPESSRLDQLYGIEKGLLHNMGEPDGLQVAFSQIMQLIRSRKERSVKIEDILVLLVHVYSLGGDKWSEKEEFTSQLEAALENALAQDAEELSEFMKNLVGEVDELSSRLVMQKFFMKLRDISEARQDLKRYRNVFEAGGRAQPSRYVSIWSQMLDDMFNPSKPELQDIEYKSAGLKDMIKTGFSLFMNVTKPRPCDNSVILLFIVGGVSCTEARHIHEIIQAHDPSFEVIIGSTKLLKPQDTLQWLLQTET